MHLPIKKTERPEEQIIDDQHLIDKMKMLREMKDENASAEIRKMVEKIREKKDTIIQI